MLDEYDLLGKSWRGFCTKISKAVRFFEKSASRSILLGWSNPPGFLKAFEKIFHHRLSKHLSGHGMRDSLS